MNYNLVIDTSNFKPFDMSYDLQILNGYRDRYQRYEDILNKIAEENGQYLLPDTPENEQYNNILNAFNKDFKAASDDFSNGMNNRNTAAIMDIYRRSRREITPINKAIEAYNKGVDKINALGPDAIIGNKGDLSKIKSYYGGANPIINYRSGKQIEQDSLKYFQGINNSLMQDDDFRSILGGQYYQKVQDGMDSSTALEAALTDYDRRTNGAHSKEVQEILNHMQNVMDAQGVEDFEEGAKEQVWNKIASGLIQSIEAPKYNTLPNMNVRYRNNRGLTANENRLIQLQAGQGYVPKLTEEGDVVRDEEGNIEFEHNPSKAANIVNKTNNNSNNNKIPNPPDGARITQQGEYNYAVKLRDQAKKEWEDAYDDEQKKKILEKHSNYDVYRYIKDGNYWKLMPIEFPDKKWVMSRYLIDSELIGFKKRESKNPTSGKPQSTKKPQNIEKPQNAKKPEQNNHKIVLSNDSIDADVDNLLKNITE